MNRRNFLRASLAAPAAIALPAAGKVILAQPEDVPDLRLPDRDYPEAPEPILAPDRMEILGRIAKILQDVPAGEEILDLDLTLSQGIPIANVRTYYCCDSFSEPTNQNPWPIHPVVIEGGPNDVILEREYVGDRVASDWVRWDVNPPWQRK